MANPLTEEHAQLYRPVLAAWIGLNEAVFLDQLNFILTRKNSVGKFADGRRWYRDKPRDFVVSYFPFWDEGIVKRVIDNLRADGILLARSDLNTRPKDRSLWYSINHSVLEKLDGPVERILNKSEKRKKARAARKDREDNQVEYTKVQNVLLNESTTECTFDPGTICTDGQVQNVPTPKDSSLKTPLPKERESRAEKLSETEQERKTIGSKLIEICGYPSEDYVIGPKLNECAKAVQKLTTWRATLKQLDQFKETYWWGKTPPTFNQVVEEWGKFLNDSAKANGAPGPASLTRPALDDTKRAAYVALQAEHEAAKKEARQRADELLGSGITAAGIDIDKEIRKARRQSAAVK